jgi:hypothetical protein
MATPYFCERFQPAILPNAGVGRRRWFAGVRTGLVSCLPVAGAIWQHGRLPEWPKGAVCKTVGIAYVGSNPTPATSKINRLTRSFTVDLDR